MGLTYRDIADILEIIDKSDCEEVVVEVGDTKLIVRRHGRGAAPPHPEAARATTAAAPATAAATSAAAATAPAVRPTVSAEGFPQGSVIVRAPMVGTFYRRPAPGEPPFVEAGQTVAAGDPLCLIEVMKLYTTIEAPAAGRIAQVLPEDASLVAHDAALFVIEPK